jgi:hypothetical protein
MRRAVPGSSKGIVAVVCFGPKADTAIPLFGQLIGCFTSGIATYQHPGKLSFEASLNLVGSDRYDECAAICET